MRYGIVQERCAKAGITPFCPRCVEFLNTLDAFGVFWLHERRAMNPMSRRTPGLYICRACGQAEALADRTGGLDDSMARTVVEQDRQEAMRLPAGNFWGATLWPTGGLDVWIRELNDRYTNLLSFAMHPSQVLQLYGAQVAVGFDSELDPDVFWKEVLDAEDEARQAAHTGARQDEGGER
jgi:hypothetical protein